MVAGFHARDAQFLIGALGNLGQRHLDADAQVGAALHALALAACSTAEEVTKAAKTAESAKQVAELSQDVFHRHAAAISTATHLLASETKLVIAGALVGVTEDVIGLGCLLEFLLGSFFLGIALALLFVRVVLDGQFAVGFLQVIGRGIFVHPQHLVVISLLSHFISKSL